MFVNLLPTVCRTERIHQSQKENNPSGQYFLKKGHFSNE